ncbi:hypothetical protein CCO04_26635 [Pimelobacter sp. 30-1]|nr:hypothetical protein [Pimelobacter sp. 30-1]
MGCTRRQTDPGRIPCAEDVVHGKPAPDLFLHAAASLAVPPAQCVVVDDMALLPAAVRRAAAAG